MKYNTQSKTGFWPTVKGERCRHGYMKRLQMQAREKQEKPGFAALMKGLPGTDPYKCILCGDRLRFAGAQAGIHATELLSERLRGMEKKRWLRMPEWDQCA